MKKLVLIGFVFCVTIVNAQIINVENLRQVTDTVGWFGLTKIDVQLTKNRNKIFSFSNRIRVQYKNSKELWLFINDLDFKEANATKLVSKNSQHVRFNYNINKKTTVEAFFQSQQDKISAIKFRGLLGAGFRFKLSNNKNYKWYFGSLAMYEYENSDEPFGTVIRKDWRNSSYISFSLFPKENISIVSTSYFQPKLTVFSDFRVSSQTSIAIDIFKNVALTTTFTYQYDAFPVNGIPKEQYKFTNGLVYFFN